MRKNSMARKKSASHRVGARPGISFEKAVAALQARLDPNATVMHDQILTDRLMQKRQFDVVIRGHFSGQPILGVIECKDLAGKVGTPEVDAFHTKSSDVLANFKIMISRRGFTAPALHKCRHYGIRTLSLIEQDPSNQGFRLGTTWYATLTRWAKIAVTLHEQLGSETGAQSFRADEVRIAGKPILAWFTNHLISNPLLGTQLGWSTPIRIDFRSPQIVEVSDNTVQLCTGVSFSAERIRDELEYFVAIGGEGFFDWQETEIIFAPASTFRTIEVPTDLRMWAPRKKEPEITPGFLVLNMQMSDELEPVVDAIDLTAL